MSEGKKEILLGDCLELMKDIPNGSIDMILCDLPYGTTGMKWDIIIPLDKLWEQYERIIKPNGAIVLTAQQPFTSKLVLSNENLFRYEWVWDKHISRGMHRAKQQPMRKHENVLVFSKLTTHNYFPIMIERDKPVTVKNYIKRDTSGERRGGRYVNNDKTYTYIHKYPDTIIIGKWEANKGKYHATQKPVSLFEYLIKTYTNENDLVLDNTAGSGTTAMACLNTKRQFIVMEKEQKYYDIILKRVADFNKNFEPQTLFGNEM